MATRGICWLAHVVTQEIRFKFRFQTRAEEEFLGWLSVGDDPEIGPLVVPLRMSHEVSFFLARAVDILAGVVTLERSFVFRFEGRDDGRLASWVTVGTRPELGPFFPNAQETDEVGELIASAVTLLLGAEDLPHSVPA